MTRSRSPALRTLPSSTWVTPSRWPIARTSAAVLRNWNDEVRAATRRPATQQRALRISSATPSQKYSWSRPGERSLNGRTAIDAVAAGSGAAAARGAASASRSKARSAADW